MIKNKIVFIGLFSSLLSDIHNTPIGWIPGTTLNANAFLTLYARNFLRVLPHSYEMSAAILGVLLTCFFIGRLRKRWLSFLVALEIVLFFLGSYCLLKMGYIWNYFLPPFVMAAGPILGWKISRWMAPR
jgi:CHASE2 domain-containing sensor protein